MASSCGREIHFEGDEENHELGGFGGYDGPGTGPGWSGIPRELSDDEESPEDTELSLKNWRGECEMLWSGAKDVTFETRVASCHGSGNGPIWIDRGRSCWAFARVCPFKSAKGCGLRIVYETPTPGECLKMEVFFGSGESCLCEHPHYLGLAERESSSATAKDIQATPALDMES